jgi:uncharacterized membrane protein
MPTQGIVPLILPVHILAGVVALVFGYVALYAAKGTTLLWRIRVKTTLRGIVGISTYQASAIEARGSQ